MLFGRMRCTAYDWIGEPAQNTPSQQAAARLVKDCVLRAPCDVQQLHPRDGNVHRLEAETACAFFDVLTPPYDASQGRGCTYYLPEGEHDGHVVLRVWEDDDVSVPGVRYRGRRVQLAWP